ncbi:hypothetical protein [Liquorilactobacillus vini]|uniref:hypothetical protein n=1 Tax=Liquorilactobacillus vini TaxID=238015 RepID=UPI000304C685|nr:hypothetical protein [Liquorilactobacillus vini]
MYSPEFLAFVRRLGDWFQEAEDDQLDVSRSDEALDDDIAIMYVLRELNSKITKDEDLLDDLFKVYQEHLKDID